MSWRKDQTWWRSGGAWGHLPALCVLVLVFCFAPSAASNYGLASDQTVTRNVGKFAVEYVLGESDNLLRLDMRYIGSAFTTVLHAAEHALGLTDVQHVYLSRYILSHGFFLLGAFACYLLAHRLFRSRLLGMFAMLFLLCHPRIFAHSFFSSKDMPFFTMYLIALLLAHGALRSGRIRAYVGLGAWIGLAGSVRPIAFLLVALVVLGQTAAFVRGSSRERGQLLLSAAALVLASCAALLLVMPYFWGDPLVRLGEWWDWMWRPLAFHRLLFMGELIHSEDRPWSYVPVWFSITTPPVVTVLALSGLAALAARLFRDARDAHADGSLRFEAVLILSVLVPLLITPFVGSIFNGWRHLYFLYGPVCLLACAGLAWLRQAAGRRLASVAAGVCAVGLASAVCWIVRLHPHEHVYFNFLVDRKTPERLRTRFDMEYWAVSHKEALEFLLDAHPTGRIPVAGYIAQSMMVLPARDRERFFLSNEFAAYFATDYRYWWGNGPSEGPTYAQPLHIRKVFSNTLYAIVRLQMDDFAGPEYAADLSAALATPPVAQDGLFAVHWDGKAITYIAENCRTEQVEGGTYGGNPAPPAGRFFLQVVGDSKSHGAAAARYYHNKDFQFRYRGVVLRDGGDGESHLCMARVALDGYVVDALRTGQLDGRFTPTWSARIVTADASALTAALARVRDGEPQARGRYDVYADGGALLYVKERCREDDRAAPFFLHVVPRDLRDAPAAVAERGFVNRGFTFATHGAVSGDACVLRVRLPPFPARTARTGQYTRERGELWRVAVALSDAGD